jgi:hypothetical protein
MPTTLPDLAAEARQQHRLLLGRLAPVVAAAFFVLLLAWNAAALQTNISLLFGHDQRRGEYNPMEPSHPIAARPAAATTARESLRSSTRRFLARPCSPSLGATGLVPP